MSTIKAITICQPWAWAIMAGHKRFEYRSWHTDYLGPLVIHAGKSDGWMLKGMNFLQSKGLSPLRAELEFGAVLGVVDVVDCKRTDAVRDPIGLPADCTGFSFALELAKPRRLAVPVPMKGALGLWNLDAAIVAELLPVEGAAAATQVEQAETKEERMQRAERFVGRDRIHRIQGNLW